ncbi:hypothetical protein TNCV_2003141 [Trichonephila clavipes]|nr:hypothetical protein TNCV_2003141 [Trichonephila clavipes]
MRDLSQWPPAAISRKDGHVVRLDLRERATTLDLESGNGFISCSTKTRSNRDALDDKTEYWIGTASSFLMSLGSVAGILINVSVSEGTEKNARDLTCLHSTSSYEPCTWCDAAMKKRQKRWFSPLVLFCAILALADLSLAVGTIPTTTETPSYPTFEDPTVEKFNHMTVHDYTERVYIGAVNRIYQLSRDLKQEDVAIMGPMDDSPKCPVTQVCPNEPKRPTDYYNKALVVDYSQSKLIACGSLFQGTCTVHDLNAVSNYETPASESVVANNATASTVAFIAPGPKNLPRTHVLYVGVSYTGNGPYRSDVPAVSSRSLDPSNMFVIAHSGVTTGTKIMLNSMSREIYPITYVYGFSSKGFSYFVTVQKMSTDPPRPFISKLVRVCQRDVQYYSYTEVPLVCRTDGTDYNLAQAAYVGRPGSELAKSLGISAQDSVLFAVFAKSKDEADIYNKPSPNSALCVYALSAVHRKFTQNIQHCFNGNGERGLDFINPSQPCYPTSNAYSSSKWSYKRKTETGTEAGTGGHDKTQRRNASGNKSNAGRSLKTTSRRFRSLDLSGFPSEAMIAQFHKLNEHCMHL